MSDPIDPIEIAAKAVVDSMCSLRAGAHDVARAVIAALEEAGYDLVKREKKTIVYTDCVLFGPPLDLPTFTPPAEERK